MRKAQEQVRKGRLGGTSLQLVVWTQVCDAGEALDMTDEIPRPRKCEQAKIFICLQKE